MMRNYFLPLGIAAAALTLGACATIEEGAVQLVSDTYRTTMMGNAIVGGAGDADGYGRAQITVSNELRQLCYDINGLAGLGDVTGVALHRGNAGENGPVVIAFSKPNEGGWKNCVTRDESLRDGIARSPSNYYVQVTTSDYPYGAIRGQLSK